MAGEPSETNSPHGEPRYRRVLVKVSGEALMGAGEYGHEPEAIARIADDLADVHRAGMQLCLVIGGGNIFRGLAGAAAGLERATADSMGMLATVINALALQSALEARSIPTRVQSAIQMAAICEPFIRRRAVRHMEKGRAVIFAAGIGSPYFSTDTAAALRAVEMNCDVILKGTQVDGVYSADPKKDKTALRYDTLSFSRVLRDDLKVMDASAIALARDNQIPIIVFSLRTENAISSVLAGKGRFTLISGEE